MTDRCDDCGLPLVGGICSSCEKLNKARKIEMEAKLRDIRAHTLLALVENIDQWGVDRNITREGGATALAQVAKMVGELEETLTTLNSMYRIEMQELLEHRDNGPKLDVLKDQLEDDYGDMLVCLIQAMRLSDTDIIECLGMAWNDIKDRKGKMIDGKFIKESDLPSHQLDEEALPELDETEKEVLAQINEAISKKEISAEAYQVIGELARVANVFDSPEVQNALTYFANHATNDNDHGEILPFSINIGVR